MESFLHPCYLCIYDSAICLSVFHYIVFEILLWYVQTGSWKEAFERVIPLRKIDKKELTDEGTANEQTIEQQTEVGSTDEQGISKQETSEQGTDEQRTCEKICTS